MNVVLAVPGALVHRKVYGELVHRIVMSAVPGGHCA
jgi:hypothetical protein